MCVSYVHTEIAHYIQLSIMLRNGPSLTGSVSKELQMGWQKICTNSLSLKWQLPTIHDLQPSNN